jgi:type VI protein secretion system component VasF
MNPEQKISTNFEHEIDAALRMLRDVQPPAGLTSRIHRSLETAAVSSQQPGRWPLWIPAAGAAMAALLLAVFLQAHFAERRQTSPVQMAELPAMDAAAAGAQPP